MPKSEDVAKHIHVGIGGWTFAPWRGVFYPDGLPHAQELSYAASRLTSIEINGTFYRTQTPATFRKWASEVPDGFIFSVKGPRYVTHRGELKDAGESVARFLNSGVIELGDRLGPLLWQFPPFKKFDEADFAGFLELLPKDFDGCRLRHVVEVRHASFCVPQFIRLLREFEVRWRLASTRPIRPSRMRQATSCICASRRATTALPPPIRKRQSQTGRRASRSGLAAARPPTSRASKPSPRESSRATYSSISSTRAKCGRLRP